MEPPVLFDDLLKLEIDPDLRTAIDRLLEIKKVTTEKEMNPHIPEIIDYIKTGIQKQKKIADELPDDHNKDYDSLNRVFREVLENC